MVEANTAGDANLSSYLADLDGGGGAGVTRETGLEGGDLAEGASPTGVDASHPKLVGGAWQQLLFFQDIHIPDIDHIYILCQKGKMYIKFYSVSYSHFQHLPHLNVCPESERDKRTL